MRASRRFSITAYTILTFFAILELFPLVLLLIMSVKSQNQIIANPLVPSAPFYFDNYLVAWESIKQYMLNTVIMAIANLVGGLTISAVAAYVFARYKFPGRNLLFGLVLALIMIPGITSLIPRFILIRDLGLLNTLWAVIIPGILGGNAFAIVVLRTFFESLSEELFEAARLDGAGHFTIFSRLVVPLSWPVLSSLAILSVIATWNDFIWPLTVLSRENLRPVSVGLYFLATDTNPQVGVQMAGSVISAIPLLILFVVAMRTFIEGITSGALKV
jgi:ABC-type glycerol-3-phosphate transport system permease component